ncbi:MAG: type II secretion system protein [Sulfuricurvum sp.]|nr:type II secretion system protein [Sulfuricurvum sp.]
MIRQAMRPAMAMIELIFAIVIIAISVLSIPSMISVADKAVKQIMIDDDVMSRLSGWAIDKFQARWDQNYQASGSGPLLLINAADLNCSRGTGTVWYRANPDSKIQCDPLNAPSVIAAGDGNLSKGIEQLNGGSEPITITAASGENYTITASYAVSYVDSALDNIVNNTASDTWTLGSSGTMSPGATGTSHLKRVVTRFSNPTLGTDIVLTFFKSNKGN